MKPITRLTAYFNDLSLTAKLALALVLFAAVLLMGVSALSFSSGRDALLAETKAELVAVADEKEASLNRMVDDSTADLAPFAADPDLLAGVGQMQTAPAGSAEAQTAHDLVVRHLKLWAASRPGYQVLFVLDPTSGQVIAASEPAFEGIVRGDRDYFTNGLKGPYFENPYYSLDAQAIAMAVSAPLNGPDKRPLGVLVARLGLDDLNRIVGQRTGLHQTDEAFLVNSSSLYVTQPRFAAGSTVLQKSLNPVALDRCLAHNSDAILADDYRGMPVVVVYRWLAERELCLVVKIDQAEAFAPAITFGQSIALIGAGFLVLAGLLSIGLARNLARPVLALRDAVDRFGRGELDQRVAVNRRDELGALGEAFNRMAGDLDRAQVALREANIDLERRVEERSRAFAQSEARYGFLFENMLNGLAYCRMDFENGRPQDFTYLGVNAAFETLTGLKDVVGKKVTEVIPGIRESDPELFETYGRVALTGVPETFETYVQALNMWFLISVYSPEKEHFAAVFDVITERKQAEEALRQLNEQLEQRVAERTAELRLSEEKFSKAFWASPAGISIASLADGRWIDVNEGLAKMTGYSREEMLGHTSTELGLVDPVAREKIMQAIREKGIVRDVEIRVRNKSNQVLDVLVSTEQVDIDGQPCVLTLQYDITDRKRAEDKINQLNVSLTEQAAQLQAANQELEAFSYSVSHDLRAPLRAMDGFSRILVEDYEHAIPQEARHYLGRIRQNAQQMGQLIDELLVFSRLGRQALKKQRVVMKELVDQVIADLQTGQDGRQVEISIGALPACQADPALLRQVWVNLLENALKYSRPREVAHIEIGSARKKGQRVYFVKDDGVGFDMQYAEKLFGVFQRLHRAEDYEGTGVGLATVQRIIHRHGGRIWAEAELDHGARFYFTLGGDK